MCAKSKMIFLFLLLATLLYSSNIKEKFTKETSTGHLLEYRKVPQSAIDAYCGSQDQSTMGETVIFMEDFEADTDGWWMDGGYNSTGGTADAANVPSLWKISEIKSNSPTHSLFHDDEFDVSRDFIFSPPFIVPETINGETVISAKLSYMLNIDNPGSGDPNNPGYLADYYMIYVAQEDVTFENVNVAGDMKYYSGYREANSFQYLTSPVIDLSSARTPISFTFDYLMDNEMHWDLGRVDILVKGEKGYTAIADLDYNDWTHKSLDISSFAGQSIQVRFTFLPDDGTNQPDGGLWIDNIKVSDASGELFMDNAEAGNAVMVGSGFTFVDRLFYDYDRVEDGGATWHQWDETRLFNGTANLFDIDIKPGDKINLVFRAVFDETTEQGEPGSAGLFIDNIAVTAISGVAADAGVSDLVIGYPQTSGQPTKIAATVSNFGYEMQSIPLWYKIGNDQELPLPPYLELEAFNDTTRIIEATFPETESTDIMATTKLPGDMAPENDAITTTIPLEPAGMATFSFTTGAIEYYSTALRTTFVDPLAVLEGTEKYTLASVDIYFYNAASAADVVKLKIAKYEDDPLTPTEVVLDIDLTFDATDGVIPVTVPVNMVDATSPFTVTLDYSASTGNVGLLLDGGTPFIGNDLIFDDEAQAWFVSGLGHIIYANITYPTNNTSTEIYFSGPIECTNGSDFWLDIKIGTSDSPVTDLLGASFVVKYQDTKWLDVVYPTDSNVIAGNFMGSNPVFFADIDDAAGKAAIGVSRKHENGGIDGEGVVAKIHFTVPENTPEGTVLHFELIDANASNSLGENIPLQSQNMDITVVNNSNTQGSIHCTIQPTINNPSIYNIIVSVEDVIDLFGLSFNIYANENKQYIEMYDVVYNGILGTDVLHFESFDNQGTEASIGVTRKSGQSSFSGNGEICQIKFRLLDAAPAAFNSSFTIENAVGSKSTGEEFVLLNSDFNYMVAVEKRTTLPTEFVLHPNHPNPFNPLTSIRYDLPQAGAVFLGIYNIKGELVRTLVDEQKAAGSYSVSWDATDDIGRKAASGVYLYRLQSSSNTATRKLLFTK